MAWSSNAQISSPADKVEDVTNAVTGTGLEPAQNPVVVVSNNDSIRVDVKPLNAGEINIEVATC